MIQLHKAALNAAFCAIAIPLVSGIVAFALMGVIGTAIGYVLKDRLNKTADKTARSNLERWRKVAVKHLDRSYAIQYEGNHHD